MTPNRRMFFGLMAASPVAAQAVAQDAQLRMAGITRLGASPIDAAAPSTADESFQKLGSFGEWLTKAGDGLRNEAKEIRALDPDIMSFRSMSLSAKIQMQRERNYQALLVDRRNWFDKQFKRLGFTKWYGE